MPIGGDIGRCPECDSTINRSVNGLRCPFCREEVFSAPERRPEAE